MAVSRDSAVVSSDNDLFNRVPDGLFSPLAGPNRSTYWQLLTVLYDSFFSWENIRIERTRKEEVQRKIESFLKERQIQLEAEGENDDAPAYYLCQRLISTGWLYLDVDNGRKYVEMPPAVAQVLAALIQVASDRVIYAGGKVAIIYNTVKVAVEEPLNHILAFIQAAEDAKEFARYMRSVVVRIQDLDEQIQRAETPGATLRTFFEDFVVNFLIADYKKLKTSDHPFRFRHNIINAVTNAILDGKKRAEFIIGYAKEHDVLATEAEKLFEEDADSLVRVFSTIDSNLERIDKAKLKLERRVATRMRYAEKHAAHVTDDIKSVLERLKGIPDSDLLTMPAMPLPLFGEARFQSPPSARAPATPQPIQRLEPSLRLRAISSLEQAAKSARYIQAGDLISYVDRHIRTAQAISSDDLSIFSVKDYCSYTTLLYLPLFPQKVKQRFRVFLSRYSIKRSNDEVTNNEFLISTKIIVTRRSESHAV